MTPLILNHPRWMIAGSVLLLVLAAASLPQLRNDPNPELLPASHASRIAHQALKQTYTGNQDVVVVMLQHADTVFNTATLARVRDLAARFADLQTVQPVDRDFLSRLSAAVRAAGGEPDLMLETAADDRDNASRALAARAALESAGRWSQDLQIQFDRYLDHLYPVVKVHALSETDNIVAADGDLLVRPVYTEVPQTADKLAAVGAEVRANELFEDLLISDDGRSTGIYLELSLAVEDASAAKALLDQIHQVIDEVPGKEQVFVAGMPVTTSTISNVIDADMGKLFPIVLAVVLVFLWLTFRDLKGVALPVAVVVTTLICTLGLMAAANVPLNVITASLPVFLISIGIADGVHFYAEYRSQYHLYGNKRAAAENTLRLLARPIILTSVTTAAAFWSLTLTEITQIAWFGVFVAAGTLLAMLFSLVLLPALVLLLPPPTIASLSDHERAGVSRIVERAVHWLDAHCAGRPRLIVGMMAGLFIVALLGASSARFDNNRVAFFGADSELVVDVKAIREALAGSEVLNIDFSSAAGGEPFKSPQLLAFLDQFEQFALAQPDVGASVSLARLVRRMNLVMHDNDPSFNAIPAPPAGDANADFRTRQLISQYVFLYENGGGDLLGDVVTPDFSSTNVKLYLRTNSSTRIASLMSLFEDYLRVHMPSGVSATFAGNGTLLVAAGEEIILGQMRSLMLCIIIVAVLLVMQFRSVRLGLLGFLPLAFAVTVNFGLLGFMGINIDIGTAIVSSIAIGIGVDFSIHYLCRFQNLRRAGYAAAEAIGGAVLTAGRAITFNALIVGSGFLALLGSGFIPINTIGWLVSLSLLVSATTTLVLVPALLRLNWLPGNLIRVTAPQNLSWKISS